MLRLILFFLIVSGLSYGTLWLLERDGTVHMEWQGYAIDMTVMASAGFITALIVVLLIIIKLIITVVNIPGIIERRQKLKRVDKALKALTQGFAAVAVADNKKARQAAQEAQKLLADHTHGKELALILSAEAAQLEGNHALAGKHFVQLLENKTTQFIAIKGLLVVAQQEGDKEKALELAEKAYHLRPNAKGIPRALLQLYKRMGKWSEAQLFLDRYSMRKRITLAGQSEEFDIKREKAIIAYMRAVAYRQENYIKKALALALEAHEAQPGFLPASMLAAELALQLGNKRRAATVIKYAWKTLPVQALGDIYLDMYPGEKPKKSVQRVLKLVALQPEHSESHRLAAQAYLQAGEIGQARKEAEKAIISGETVSLCQLMAEIESKDETGRPDKVARWQEHEDHTLSDPVWKCYSCQHELDSWQVVCPECDALDSITWSVMHGYGQEQEEVDALLLEEKK